MPQTQLSNPQSDIIDRPPCPKCGKPMWMVQVDYKNSMHDRQTFECPVCEGLKPN
jgi:hypothetical protein